MSNGNDNGLGRRVPTDWKHYEKFPLSAVGVEAAYGPVVWGINWYSNFDDPVEKYVAGIEPGAQEYIEYWIGEGDLGSVRGGHAIAQPYRGAGDLEKWYYNYDQGSEGACVGFSLSRAMSWFNRQFYDGFWLYHTAQKYDEWDGEDYEGTSVRAGANVLRYLGHSRIYEGRTLQPQKIHGIDAYRWTNNVEDVLNVVGGIQKERGAITFRNSWGTYYPQKVWLPAETAQRLIDEDGEICVPTDR